MELYLGDCLDVMGGIQAGTVDLVLCDLPYGTTGLDWETPIPLDALWAQYKRVLKPNGTVLLFGSEPFASVLRLSNPEMYRYDWVWEKNICGNFQLVSVQPMKIHETISVFYDIPKHYEFSEIIKDNMDRLGLSKKDVTPLFLSKNGNTTGWLSNKMSGKQMPTREQWSRLCELFGIEDEYDKILSGVNRITYNPDTIDVELVRSNKGKSGRLGHISSEKRRDEYVQKKTGYPKSIIRFDRETGLHPTQKPVALMEFLVKTHSNPGDLVLDNCMGSGTTGVACAKTGRDFVGIEISPEYFCIAKERIDKETRDKDK